MVKKLVLVMSLCLMSLQSSAEVLDYIVAVVEEDVVLESELTTEVRNITAKLKQNKVMMPPPFILRKQVLERIIVEKLQRQLAAKSGIQVSEEMLRASVSDIARRNNLSLDSFRQELENEGIGYKEFQENIRNEIIVNQLRAREIGSRIKVTDQEVNHYLETQGQIGEEKVQYQLGHILVSVPEAASSGVIQKAQEKASQVISQLRNGADFRQTAIANSDSDNALSGGDLGWRTIANIPTLFVDVVSKMKVDEIAEAIRSPSGFHIIKLLGVKGLDKHIVTKTHVRHILVKTNELLNDAEARKRLGQLRDRIIDGDDFASLARSNSDDKGSALKGGDLGWVGSGVLVPRFEDTMKQLTINEISEPIQTQFGWHIIQVLGREDKDNSAEFQKEKVREEIRKRKIEEETELWLRRLRDEAFVEINLDRL